MSIFKPRMHESNFLFAVIMTTAKMLFYLILILGVAASGLLVGVAKAWVETAPALDLTVFGSQAKTSFIYDKYGTLITDFKGSQNRIDATWEEIPTYLINATIAVEDQRFYTHNGVDIKRIVGALITNLLNNNMQGGSTITQQLVKLTMLTSEQNYKRKMQEAYLALQLEQKIGKERILLEYLNCIYLGGSDYGVKVAAMDYFGKELNELTLRECAALARVIRHPYKYNPRKNYYSRQTPEVIEDGADHVLKLMYDQGLITDEEYARAKNERLEVCESSAYTNDLYDHAYFVEYAIYDVVTKMLRAEGIEDTTANRSKMENRLRTGGYRIYTTLDGEVQEAVQSVITNWDQYPATRYSADKVYKASLGNGEYLQVVEPQAACTVIDWSSGEIVALVGGRSIPVQKKQYNRAYQSTMPVGSSIKPLAIYGPALDLGNSPGSPVINAPLKIDGWDTEKGYPNNFSGSTFTGIESMRVAMMKSHNTAAAQALFTYVGIENSVTYLLRLGVNRSHINATGAGLALGSSGITTVEMAAGFGAIANKGKYLEPYAFTRVYDSANNIVLDVQSVQTRRQAFKESTAYMLVDMLKGCVSSKGTGSSAKFGNFTVVGKTGTNSDYRGVFFAGMTGYYSCAVWIGHDNYKPLTSSASGGTYAAPLWAAVMKKVHEKEGITRDRDIIPGDPSDYGLIKATCCAVSGMLATNACGRDANGYGVNTDYYLKGTQPTQECNMHRTMTLCTKSRKVPNDYCTSTSSYGVLYIPEGHPLRNDDIDKVRDYFHGASYDKGASAIGVCTRCGGKYQSKSSSSETSQKLSTVTEKADSLVAKANKLLQSDNLTTAQKKKLKSAVDKTMTAVDNQSYNSIVKYGKQLQQLIKKYS